MKTTVTRYRYEVMLPTEVEHDRWRQEAKDRQMSVSEMIKTAVNQYISSTGDKQHG